MASLALLACSGPPRFTSRVYEPPDSPPAQVRFEESTPRRSNRINEITQELLGIRYRYGGHSIKGFDCSGLVQHIYEQCDGTRLPRTVEELFNVGEPVRRDQWRAGDLVFFEIRGHGPSHVGLYLGRDRFVHASPSEGVAIAALSDPYYECRYIGARRPID